MAFWNKKKKKKSSTKHKTVSKPPQKKPETLKSEPILPKEPPKPKKEQSKSNVDTEKEFLRVFKELTYRHRDWDIWRDFVIMTATALSNPVDKAHFDEREARYMKIIKKYNKKRAKLISRIVCSDSHRLG